MDNNLAAATDIYSKKKVSKKLMEDISYGVYISYALNRNDCGQSIVVKNKTIMAVESSEGRIANIKRGCELSNNKAVIIITNKLSQDDRDKVIISMDILQLINKYKVSAIALEEGVYLSHIDELSAYAVKNNILLLSYNQYDIINTSFKEV